MSAPVLLIHPPCPDGPPMYFGPPYGIALIAACLGQAGREVICRDFERSTVRQMIDACDALIREHNIRTIGIGGTVSSRGPVTALVRALRQADPSLVLILGGPFATQLHPQLLRWLDIDFVVRGDGEETLGALLNCLDRGDDPATVAGLAFLRGDELVVTPDRPRVRDLDRLPQPAFERFDVARSLVEHRRHLATGEGQQQLRSIKGKRCSSIPSGLMVLSSYGCAYQCVFCPMSGAASPRYREHSPAYFVDLLEHFASTYAQRHFIFGDGLFTRDADRVRAICDDILGRGLKLEWMCMTRTDHVDAQLLGHMAAAGCVEIVFGVESCSPAIQASIRKGLDLSTVGPALDACDQARIHSVMSLMVGNPGETIDTVHESLVQLRELEPDEAQVKIVKVYPGTELHKHALEAGILTLEDYQDPGPHPPPYTAEHDGAALDRLARMIRPRTLYFDAAPGRPAADLERDLRRVVRRAHHLRFCAGDTLREDLGPLLGLARELRTPVLELEASASALADETRWTALLVAGVDRLVVRISAEFDPHLGETLQRLHAGTRVTAHLDLVDAMVATLTDTVTSLISAGVKDFHFSYAPAPGKGTPTPERGAQALRTCFDRWVDSPPHYRITGLPGCYLPDLAAAIDDIHRPFDERLDGEGHLRNLGRERRRQRQQTAACASCELRTICEGFWRVDLAAQGSPTP